MSQIQGTDKVPRKPHGRRLARCTLYTLACGSEQGYRFADRGADLRAISLIVVFVVFGSVLYVYDGLPLPQWCFAELVIFGKISANKRPSLPVLFVSIFFRTPVGRPQKGSTPPRLAPDTTWLECAGRAATRRSGLLSLQGVITNGTWRLCRSGV